MSKITATEVRNMMGAYNAVYSPQESLEQEIFETVAYALISQGHTAIDVLEYFANVDNEVIAEDIFAIVEGTLLIESVVSEEYIEEQMQQLDEILGAALRIGQAAVKGAQFAQKTGMLARAGGALKAAGTAATRVAQQGAKASAVVRPAIGRALQGAKGAIGGAISNIKNVATGALNKLPGGAGGKLAGAAKLAGKAVLGGAAFEGGMRAVQALAGGGGGAPAAKTAPTGDKAKFNASAALGGKTAFAAGGGAAAMKKDPKLTAADIQKRGTEALFKAGGGKSAEVQKGQTRAQVIAQGSKNVAPKATVPAKPTPAAAAPEVKATNTIAAKPTQPAVAPAKPKTEPAAKPAGQSTMSQQAAELRDMQKASQMRQQGQDVTGANITSVRKDVEKFNKPEELNKPAPAGTALAAEQERRRKAQAQAEAQKQTVSASYEYDAYDLVLEYLFDTEQAETVKEAHYLMTEMNSEMIQSIVEAKRKSYSAKKARKGEDLGLPGKGFGKIAKEAGERYGSEERGEKVAGAVLKGLRAKHGK